MFSKLVVLFTATVVQTSLSSGSGGGHETTGPGSSKTRRGGRRGHQHPKGAANSGSSSSSSSSRPLLPPSALIPGTQGIVADEATARLMGYDGGYHPGKGTCPKGKGSGRQGQEHRSSAEHRQGLLQGVPAVAAAGNTVPHRPPVVVSVAAALEQQGQHGGGENQVPAIGATDTGDAGYLFQHPLAAQQALVQAVQPPMQQMQQSQQMQQAQQMQQSHPGVGPAAAPQGVLAVPTVVPMQPGVAVPMGNMQTVLTHFTGWTSALNPVPATGVVPAAAQHPVMQQQQQQQQQQKQQSNTVPPAAVGVAIPGVGTTTTMRHPPPPPPAPPVLVPTLLATESHDGKNVAQQQQQNVFQQQPPSVQPCNHHNWADSKTPVSGATTSCEHSQSKPTPLNSQASCSSSDNHSVKSDRYSRRAMERQARAAERIASGKNKLPDPLPVGQLPREVQSQRTAPSMVSVPEVTVASTGRGTATSAPAGNIKNTSEAPAPTTENNSSGFTGPMWFRKDAIPLPDKGVASAEPVSKGFAQHVQGKRCPRICKYMHKPGGPSCKDGKDCDFCHLCPRPGRTESGKLETWGSDQPVRRNADGSSRWKGYYESKQYGKMDENVVAPEAQHQQASVPRAPGPSTSWEMMRHNDARARQAKQAGRSTSSRTMGPQLSNSSAASSSTASSSAARYHHPGTSRRGSTISTAASSNAGSSSRAPSSCTTTRKAARSRSRSSSRDENRNKKMNIKRNNEMKGRQQRSVSPKMSRNEHQQRQPVKDVVEPTAAASSAAASSAASSASVIAEYDRNHVPTKRLLSDRINALCLDRPRYEKSKEADSIFGQRCKPKEAGSRSSSSSSSSGLETDTEDESSCDGKVDDVQEAVVQDAKAHEMEQGAGRAEEIKAPTAPSQVETTSTIPTRTLDAETSKDQKKQALLEKFNKQYPPPQSQSQKDRVPTPWELVAGRRNLRRGGKGNSQRHHYNTDHCSPLVFAMNLEPSAPAKKRSSSGGLFSEDDSSSDPSSSDSEEEEHDEQAGVDHLVREQNRYVPWTTTTGNHLATVPEESCHNSEEASPEKPLCTYCPTPEDFDDEFWRRPNMFGCMCPPGATEIPDHITSLRERLNDPFFGACDVDIGWRDHFPSSSSASATSAAGGPLQGTTTSNSSCHHNVAGGAPAADPTIPDSVLHNERLVLKKCTNFVGIDQDPVESFTHTPEFQEDNSQDENIILQSQLSQLRSPGGSDEDPHDFDIERRIMEAACRDAMKEYNVRNAYQDQHETLQNSRHGELIEERCVEKVRAERRKLQIALMECEMQKQAEFSKMQRNKEQLQAGGTSSGEKISPRVVGDAIPATPDNGSIPRTPEEQPYFYHADVEVPNQQAVLQKLMRSGGVVSSASPEVVAPENNKMNKNTKTLDHEKERVSLGSSGNGSSSSSGTSLAARARAILGTASPIVLSDNSRPSDDNSSDLESERTVIIADPSSGSATGSDEAEVDNIGNLESEKSAGVISSEDIKPAALPAHLPVPRVAARHGTTRDDPTEMEVVTNASGTTRLVKKGEDHNKTSPGGHLGTKKAFLPKGIQLSLSDCLEREVRAKEEVLSEQSGAKKSTGPTSLLTPMEIAKRVVQGYGKPPGTFTEHDAWKAAKKVRPGLEYEEFCKEYYDNKASQEPPAVVQSIEFEELLPDPQNGQHRSTTPGQKNLRTKTTEVWDNAVGGRHVTPQWGTKTIRRGGTMGQRGKKDQLVLGSTPMTQDGSSCYARPTFCASAPMPRDTRSHIAVLFPQVEHNYDYPGENKAAAPVVYEPVERPTGQHQAVQEPSCSSRRPAVEEGPGSQTVLYQAPCAGTVPYFTQEQKKQTLCAASGTEDPSASTSYNRQEQPDEHDFWSTPEDFLRAATPGTATFAPSSSSHLLQSRASSSTGSTPLPRPDSYVSASAATAAMTSAATAAAAVAAGGSSSTAAAAPAPTLDAFSTPPVADRVKPKRLGQQQRKAANKRRSASAGAKFSTSVSQRRTSLRTDRLPTGLQPRDQERRGNSTRVKQQEQPTQHVKLTGPMFFSHPPSSTAPTDTTSEAGGVSDASLTGNNMASSSNSLGSSRKERTRRGRKNSTSLRREGDDSDMPTAVFVDLGILARK
ncbi:unnamed protein product [Amoebophrya sp. A120]|nr:unnamed protein product [Amoebophrya sp. A120]|eukprot:GSA120T00013473001.1